MQIIYGLLVAVMVSLDIHLTVKQYSRMNLTLLIVGVSM